MDDELYVVNSCGEKIWTEFRPDSHSSCEETLRRLALLSVKAVQWLISVLQLEGKGIASYLALRLALCHD
jgi:hypothetical protein